MVGVGAVETDAATPKRGAAAVVIDGNAALVVAGALVTTLSFVTAGVAPKAGNALIVVNGADDGAEGVAPNDGKGLAVVAGAVTRADGELKAKLSFVVAVVVIGAGTAGTVLAAVVALRSSMMTTSGALLCVDEGVGSDATRKKRILCLR